MERNQENRLRLRNNMNAVKDQASKSEIPGRWLREGRGQMAKGFQGQTRRSREMAGVRLPSKAAGTKGILGREQMERDARSRWDGSSVTQQSRMKGSEQVHKKEL